MIRLATAFEEFISPILSSPGSQGTSTNDHVVIHNKGRYPELVIIKTTNGSEVIQQTRMRDQSNISGIGNRIRGFACIHDDVNTTTIKMYFQDTNTADHRAHFYFND